MVVYEGLFGLREDLQIVLQLGSAAIIDGMKRSLVRIAAAPFMRTRRRCPHCGSYISEEDATVLARKPWWIIVGALLGLYAVYRWIL